MRDLLVRWVWATETPLHCGTGISRPGVADRLVRLDPQGRPLIVGEAVKGAVRMSAERMAAWLGNQQDYEEDSSREPQALLLALVFGGHAVAHFEPAVLRDDAGGHSIQIVASTAIDSETGTAHDQSLRKTQIVAKGVQFKCACRVAVSDEHVDGVATLLVGALAATESIAGKDAIGWGRVKLDWIDVEIDGTKLAGNAIDNLVSEERVRKLRAALGLPKGNHVSPAGVLVSDAAPADARPDGWFRIRIRLEEPACFPAEPETSNHVESEDGIRATALRGAFRALGLRTGVPHRDVDSWLSHATRWSPGFPLDDAGRCLPAPRSYVVPKPAKGTSPAVMDVFGDTPPIGAKMPKRAWVAWNEKNGGMLVDLSRRKDVRMHVARDYKTGGKWPGALYSKESIVEPGAEFEAWAFVPASGFPRGEHEIFLGKRKSAGNGRAIATVTEAEEPDFHGSRPEGTVVVVQLLSPAIVRGANGYFRRGLSGSDWCELAGVSSLDILVDVREAGVRRGSWMATWGHPRAAVTCVEAGSIWKIECRDHGTVLGLYNGLKSKTHIGERGHEGFGWFAVNPPWAREASLPHDQIAPEGAQRWPGWTRPDVDPLLAVLRDLPVSIDPGVRKPIQTLMRMIRDAHSKDELEAVRKFCAERSGRERPGAWKDLAPGEPIGKHLSASWEDRDLLLFALNALAIRASEVRP